MAYTRKLKLGRTTDATLSAADIIPVRAAAWSARAPDWRRRCQFTDLTFEDQIVEVYLIGHIERDTTFKECNGGIRMSRQSCQMGQRTSVL